MESTDCQCEKERLRDTDSSSILYDSIEVDWKLHAMFEAKIQNVGRDAFTQKDECFSFFFS